MNTAIATKCAPENRPNSTTKLRRSTPPAWQQRLVEMHVPLAKRIARWVYSHYPKVLEVEDLESAAYIALVDAASRFDPSRGVAFHSYAGIRIRGGVVDALRTADWAPTSARRLRTRIDSIRVEHRTEFGVEATTPELAERLGVGVDRFHHLHQVSSRGEIDSLDATTDDGRPLHEVLTGSVPTVDEDLDGVRQIEALHEAIDTLPERERTIVTAYYLEERRLKDIAAELGVTDSRVCQVARQAVERLRGRLAGAVH